MSAFKQGQRIGVERGSVRMNRCAIHDLPKAHVATRLRKMGLDVQVMRPVTRHDFLLDGKVRVALRSALPFSRLLRMRVGKRWYRYVYQAWVFHFHHHGRIGRRYCDFFICVPLVSHDPDLRTAFILPWEARGAKAFHLPESRRPYRGKYAPYRNAWQQLLERCHSAA